MSCKIIKNAKLKEYSSFHIGGNCKMLAIPRNINELKEVINYDKKFIIGNGTNILFPDKYDGVIIKISEPYFYKIEKHNNKIIVGSGTFISTLINFCIENEIGGLEFMVGIPGTIGGAIAMNSGATGKSIGEFVEKVKIMSNIGEIYYLANNDCEFTYRGSKFKGNGEIILEATLNLYRKEKEKIKKEINERLKERKKRIPKKPNIGCIFKNTKNVSAGKLIDMAGCKGLRFGDAMVSYEHANFIINVGNATSDDVKKLMNKIIKIVYNKFNIKLEPEIVIIE